MCISLEGPILKICTSNILANKSEVDHQTTSSDVTPRDCLFYRSTCCISLHPQTLLTFNLVPWYKLRDLINGCNLTY